MFHKDKPVDWLMDHILWVKVCNPEKDAVSYDQVAVLNLCNPKISISRPSLERGFSGLHVSLLRTFQFELGTNTSHLQETSETLC